MPVAAAVNETFVANMTQLWRLNPRLAQRIDDLPLDASLEVAASKAGPATACVQTADGRTLWLHSRYDPLREARDFCKTLEKTEAFCVLLAGLGMGYHVKALFETLGDETIIFIGEPDIVVVKTALEHTDLSKELATGRVELLTDLEKGDLHERLGRHATMLMLGTVLATPPPARDHRADWHNMCFKAVMDFASFAKMSLVTLVRNSGITCRNIANNLPTYVSTPPIDLLRKKLAGLPAILVAAGPSLAKQLGALRDLQDRAVIICAQTTLRVLLEQGIRPRFVTSLDFSEMSRQFFENLDIPDDLVLVAEPKASWHVIDAFRGVDAKSARRVVLLDNVFAHRCLGEALAKRTPIEPGATVMHLAYYLAQWLGCDPIIFVGQDLAFTGHCYYTPGVAMHRAWHAELGRFGTLEMKEWERIVRHRQILRKVRDAAGRELYTDEQMFTYLEQFERDFARSTARVIDATEGGAQKAGATPMTLSLAATKFCRDPIDPDRFNYLSAGWHDASRLASSREVLVSRRADLERFQKVCAETRDILKELEGLVGDPAKFNRRLVRVDELRTLVQQQELIFQMVRDVSQLGELQKFAADRRITVDEVTGKTRAGRQVQRDRRFLDALLDGCRFLDKILSEAVERFDRAIEAGT